MPEVRRAAALVVLLTALAGPAAAEELRFTDERIDESSGLAFAGRLLVTTNDSGDGPVLYVVDPRTGDTVGTTTYGVPVTDVEALAQAGGGAVWVGDIGDNGGRRSEIAVHRVEVGRGERSVRPVSLRLRYDDGPRDAEALLVHPRTGRIYVLSKSLEGSVLYAAPRRPRPDRVGVLRRVGTVPGWLTDGSFLPDGSGLVVRDYGGAALYTWPGLSLVRDLRLPARSQGESITVRGGVLWTSTEGVFGALDRTPLPPSPSSAATTPTPRRGSVAMEERAARSERPWRRIALAAGAAAAVVGTAVGLAWWLRRRRGPAV